MAEGMHLSARYALSNIEIRVYELLMRELESVDGESAYLDEYTKGIRSASDGLMWTFRVHGGGEEQPVPMPFWSMKGEFVAVGVRKADLHDLWGKLADLLKTTGDKSDFGADGWPEGLVSLRFAGGPQFDRAKVEIDVDKDQTKGGPQRSYMMQVPLAVDFLNTEPAVAGTHYDERNEAQA